MINKAVKLLLMAVTILVCMTTPMVGAAQTDVSKFLEAKKAASKGQWDLVENLKSELADHPLYPYLDYYYLRSHFTTVDDSAIQLYLETYPKTPMADKLRKKWLYEFAENKQWDQFLRVYQPTSNVSLRCYYFTALHETGKKTEAFSEIKPLWLTTKAQPDSCLPLFEKWLSASPNKDQLIWERFELALLKKDFKLANKLAEKFSPAKKKSAKQILALYKNPHMVKKKSFLDKKPIAEVVSYGLARLARISPKAGINQWKKLRKKYTFTEQQEQRLFQTIGLTMAVRKNAESTKWFRKVLGADLAPLYKDWMIRSAIIYEDWQLVLDSIDALKPEERNTLRWQYWYGRGLQKLGKIEQANQVLSKVAEERNYYGFLANYYMNKPITVKHEELVVTPEEIDTVKNMPGFQRAMLLYQLNFKHDARVELFTLMKHVDEKQEYIVTKLVSEIGWYPQSLRLSSYPDHKDDIIVRFPLPYREEVEKNAKKYNVDPALIYAIMRQESYFMPLAKSPAGAVGLMQLMPGTANRTSKKFKINYNGKSDLTNGVKNISLGSAHLKELSQEFNSSPALMIAAYNAGKKAAKRWIPKAQIPTDVWVETVSYYETRGYLRSVIANYIVYQHRLGVEPSLDKIMKKL